MKMYNRVGYASEIHDNSGVNQYAQRLISTAGKQDGLAWQNADGSWGGPISEVVAKAIDEGYGERGNIAVGLPYGVGTFQASVLGTNQQIYRSGLLDMGLRLSVNLKGGLAMPLSQFVKWKQKTLLGASLKVIPPTGQYDPTKLVNWGINRWAFKPEFGYSRRCGKWWLDGYAGVWFFTTNQKFYSVPTPKPQTESPIGSFESHLSYDAKNFRGKPPLWFSLDGNFWYGGTTSLGGISNSATRQTSSRIGVTAAIPLSQHQSIKASFSTGSYVRFGGDYQNMSISWQYSWLGRPN